MVFLAVTLGFIAENIRENVSDHRKEMELIRSLVKDLRDDGAIIIDQLKVSKPRLLYSDSLINLVHEDSVVSKKADFIFWS